MFFPKILSPRTHNPFGVALVWFDRCWVESTLRHSVLRPGNSNGNEENDEQDSSALHLHANSIFGRLFCVIDHHELNRPFAGFQFESELLLQRGEDGGSTRVIRL
jgi:hypothetical protein